MAYWSGDTRGVFEELESIGCGRSSGKQIFVTVKVIVKITPHLRLLNLPPGDQHTSPMTIVIITIFHHFGTPDSLDWYVFHNCFAFLGA